MTPEQAQDSRGRTHRDRALYELAAVPQRVRSPDWMPPVAQHPPKNPTCEVCEPYPGDPCVCGWEHM